ncbi:MAG: SDR family NAD(P)-dependent oxidoreductase [Candidatus Ranarchaeia archaeon]
MRLLSKIVMITGAASGIGRAFAVRAAKEGADVALLDMNEKGLKETLSLVEAQGRKGLAVKVDVTSQQQVKEVFQKVIADLGVPTVLVNSAGVFTPQSYFDTTEDVFDKLFAVNVKGIFFMCRAATDYWIAHKLTGKIINFSSIAGRIVMPYNLPYATVKAAVIHMSKIIALEVGKYGINVNVICPGLVDTPMARPFLSKPDLLKGDLARIPMGRIQTVDECADAILFLASDASNQVTGEVIGVDGGWHIGHP